MLRTLDPARIVGAYRGASASVRAAGRAWYRESAARTLGAIGAASTGRLNREQSAAIVSLLSPRTPWRVNIRRALDVAVRVTDGRDPGAVSGAFAYARPLIRRAVASPDPADCFRPETGPKTAAFFRNLCGDLQPVTVDVWAARAVGLGDADLGNLNTYSRVADCYTEAARIVGDAPASVQAVAWIVERRAAGAFVYQSTFAGFGLAPETV